jgi:F-type H+-transporting ATPase subunit epsilon
MPEGRLHLTVVTPTRTAVEAEVDEVTLPGALGALGILPGHTPLLTSLRIGELSYRQGVREHYLALQWGFAEVTSDASGDRVTVLAEVAELPEEIDVEQARTDKQAAEAAMRTASGEELETQRAHLEAAVTRITVAARR